MKMSNRRNYCTLQLVILFPFYSVTSFLQSYTSTQHILVKTLSSSEAKPRVSAIYIIPSHLTPCGTHSPHGHLVPALYSSQQSSDETVTAAPSSELGITVSDPAKRSRLSKEFFSMMDDFSEYTPNDIAAVNNPRYRALFSGIAAGAETPPVLRAFEVLYEDMIPLRVAGRMIYRHLQNVMDTSLEQRESETRIIEEKTGLSAEEIDNGRVAFLALKNDDEREGLSIEQLVDSGIVATAVELFGYQSFDEFLTKMDKDEKGLLNFEEFMIGLQRCSVDSNADTCTIPYVLEEIANKMVPVDEENSLTTVDQRKKKYIDRYENMVETFKEWEDRVPNGEGRMLDVLRGCFVGARSEEIVNALRIVYLDYSALRVAGDLVFKLSKKLMNKKRQ